MQPTQSPTIVLADDDQFIAVAYRAGLEQAGYQVMVAKDGQQALDLIRIERPKLLLLDLIMPRLNGFEVLATMRAEGLLALVPVLVLTNLGQDRDEAEVRSYGVQDFLVKATVSLQDIIDRIDQILSAGTETEATEA